MYGEEVSFGPAGGLNPLDGRSHNGVRLPDPEDRRNPPSLGRSRVHGTERNQTVPNVFMSNNGYDRQKGMEHADRAGGLFGCGKYFLVNVNFLFDRFLRHF